MRAIDDMRRKSAWAGLDEHWQEVLRNVAQDNPFVHSIMAAHENGCSTLNDALVSMVVALHRQNAHLTKIATDAVALLPRPAIVVKDAPVGPLGG